MDTYLYREARELRRCVCFLVQKSKQSAELIPKATGFFVGVGEPEPQAAYVVTARHNLEFASKAEPLVIRMNTSNGKSEDIPTRIEDWIQDSKTDIAIIYLPQMLDESTLLDAPLIPLSMLVNEQHIKQGQFQEGSEVCMPSLFAKYHGNGSVLPLIRSGRLALIPSEPIEVKLGPKSNGKIPAYLIECLSWGGCSGAPVFVNRVEFRDGQSVKRIPHEHISLLGLLSSHYDQVKEAKVAWSDVEETDVDFPLNAGVAVVIPATDIRAFIESEEHAMEILKSTSRNEP